MAKKENADLTALLKTIPAETLQHLFKPPYRKRKKPLRIQCTHPDYEDAWVELPAEWLGKHAIRKEEVVSLFDELSQKTGKKSSEEAIAVAIALALAEGFGNIPGIKGEDPSEWRIEDVPIPVMSWLQNTVNQDFMSAYQVPFPFVNDSGEESSEKETD